MLESAPISEHDVWPMARWLAHEYRDVAYQIAVTLAHDSLQFGMKARTKKWCEIAIAVEQLLMPSVAH